MAKVPRPPCGGRKSHIIPYLGASPEAIKATPRIRGAPSPTKAGANIVTLLKTRPAEEGIIV